MRSVLTATCGRTFVDGYRELDVRIDKDHLRYGGRQKYPSEVIIWRWMSIIAEIGVLRVSGGAMGEIKPSRLRVT